jgi:plastocyanin
MAAGAAVAVLAPGAQASVSQGVGIDDTGATMRCPVGDAYCFVPSSISVAGGTTVTWSQNSTTPHTVTADSGSAEQWDSGNLDQGATFSHTFLHMGTFTYHCAYHSFMTGKITVTSNAPSTPPASTPPPRTPAPTAATTTTTRATTSTTQRTTSTTSAAAPTAAVPAPLALGASPAAAASASPSGGDLAVPAAAGGSGGGSSSTGLIVAVVVLVLVGGSGAALWMRRRAGT